MVLGVGEGSSWQCEEHNLSPPLIPGLFLHSCPDGQPERTAGPAAFETQAPTRCHSCQSPYCAGAGAPGLRAQHSQAGLFQGEAGRCSALVPFVRGPALGGQAGKGGLGVNWVDEREVSMPLGGQPQPYLVDP